MADSTIKNKNTNFRFADVGTLPKHMLPPIEGYQKMPLVTLEEAVEPLVQIVPNVKRSVYIVKQNCQNPEDGLTTDESASIMLYTFESMPNEHSLYAKLNTALRSDQRQILNPWFLYLRLILTALSRLPSKRRSVFRGVKKNLSSEYKEGMHVIWWEFSSCTSSIEMLENEQLFGRTGSRTLFQIQCKTAKDITKHSLMSSEDEILLLPATQFQVEAYLDSGNGLHIVGLTELDPMFSLLEPVLSPIQATQPLAKCSMTSQGQ
ncbi:unnamed protein product [Rotaria sp. Silwood2]|nr:unnamed protein product [Rotaria sp. Silwood2]CAF3142472.1 unnamed protein product [Rotaria sp. Silwood2]CAF3457990.1 unnamed protein product [Rotaria sp. Silwood2]CAF4046959.1 unnamed protein product [Rotaria sp. Silwood2]CAF4484545.1 unnamed protein product [Rotaria sp. Silwood2]